MGRAGAGLLPGAVDFLLKLRGRAADVVGEAVCRAVRVWCGRVRQGPGIADGLGANVR